MIISKKLSHKNPKWNKRKELKLPSPFIEALVLLEPIRGGLWICAARSHCRQSARVMVCNQTVGRGGTCHTRAIRDVTASSSVTPYLVPQQRLRVGRQRIVVLRLFSTLVFFPVKALFIIFILHLFGIIKEYSAVNVQLMRTINIHTVQFCTVIPTRYFKSCFFVVRVVLQICGISQTNLHKIPPSFCTSNHEIYYNNVCLFTLIVNMQ